MNPETKNCQNCKKDFVIEPEDFQFYTKIKVPPPTWCPECRARRRFSWRNTWHLYKKEDDLTGEMIFSSFPPQSKDKIYDRDYWWSDAWDATKYGKDIDWNRPFLEQFRELLNEVPLSSHSARNNVNCEYCTNINSSKNCYLVRAAANVEDSAYLIWDESSRHCMDSHMTDHCELSYGNVNMARCYKAFFSMGCEDCRDIYFCKDCVGCSDCIGCTGLRGKSYHIFNIPHGKEEYARKLEEFNVSSWRSLQELKSKTDEAWLRFPVKFMHGLQNTNVSGDYVYNSKSAQSCYRVREMENCKYCMNILSGPVKDCYDYTNWGQGSELIYESIVCGFQAQNIKFCWNVWSSVKNIEYSIYCQSSSDLFGCVSIRKGQYCILNKQYTKNEYEALLPRVIQHMKDVPYTDSAGREYPYGEFFPSEMSPFPFNITEAQELFPMNEVAAEKEGLWWLREDNRSYVPTLRAENLADNVKDEQDSILTEVVECAHKGACDQECTNAFRMILQELEFLRRMNLPLPRLCPNCRHYERLKMRNLPKFISRACQCSGERSFNGTYRNTCVHAHGATPCPNKFETSYAPERPEIVYCEQCYNAEVA